MPNSQQLRMIHMGARHVGLIDAEGDTARYKLMLRNVADVDSSTGLTQAGVEDVMAVLEDMGFDEHRQGPTYWRDKVAVRGVVCGARMLFKIEQLAARQPYPLPSLCLKFSDSRTREPGELRPREAWELIEMLKSAGGRPPREAAPALFS